MTSYSKEDFLIMLKNASKNMQTFYQQGLVNYVGTLKGTKEKYSEFTAKYLIEKLHLFNEIKAINRESSYKIKSHKGEIINYASGRDEEIMAKFLYKQKYIGDLGEVLDYQVPLKNVQKDEKIGKIDLLSYDKTNEILYLLELKKPDSKETMIRCVLEIYTYKNILNHEKLIKDYNLPKSTKIVAAPFVYSRGYQKKDHNDKHPYLLDLMDKLNIKPYYYDVKITEQYIVAF